MEYNIYYNDHEQVEMIKLNLHKFNINTTKTDGELHVNLINMSKVDSYTARNIEALIRLEKSVFPVYEFVFDNGAKEYVATGDRVFSLLKLDIDYANRKKNII